MQPSPPAVLRFGTFELDVEAGQLLKSGRPVHLQPQPFKLLWLLASHAGHLLTREQIRAALWTGDTFVDFDQGVNFAVKQVREALNDDADRPLYIQTIPRRGYKFIAPVETKSAGAAVAGRGGTDLNLQKVLWTNIAELRLAEASRASAFRRLVITVAIALVLGVVLGLMLARR